MLHDEKSTGKPQLFTYTIPIDDGSAPNPFRGLCTLAICKPGIRRAAKKGDWVAGLGSKNAPSRDLSGHLVYAMCVEEAITFADYDDRAREEWPHRIPNISSPDLVERLGDCIYDYSTGKPRQRRGVHGPKNIETDLWGGKVLISHDFYYFGSKAIKLRRSLHPICHQGQGHKSDFNAPYVGEFIDWLRGLSLIPGEMYGWPDFMVNWSTAASCGGCVIRARNGKNDKPCRT